MHKTVDKQLPACGLIGKNRLFIHSKKLLVFLCVYKLLTYAWFNRFLCDRFCTYKSLFINPLNNWLSTVSMASITNSKD